MTDWDDAACLSLIQPCSDEKCQRARHRLPRCVEVASYREFDRLFFRHSDKEAEREAVDLCARCPIAEPCLLEAATATPEAWEHGIYAGLRGWERKHKGGLPDVEAAWELSMLRLECARAGHVNTGMACRCGLVSGKAQQALEFPAEEPELAEVG